MHYFASHCCDAPDENGYGIVAVGGDDGRFVRAYCPCQDHEELGE